MRFKEQLTLKLHNWRLFEQVSFNLPKQSFVLVDDNGSGKTSLISSFYSLFTGQSFPSTKLIQHLQVGKEYFGVSAQYPDWSFTGQISSSGRLVTKYQKIPSEYFSDLFEKENTESTYQIPKILTYLPTDNYWFSQSRGAKLDILDNLLTQVLPKEYAINLENLDKSVKSKQKLIKHAQEFNGDCDQILLTTINEAILASSLEIWQYRLDFFNFLQDQLSDFQSQINSPIKDWQIRWDLSNGQGTKDLFSISKSAAINFLNLTPDWRALWHRELLSGKVLFGAQRDDFRIISNHLNVEDVFSRGEMRLFVLFIKNTARKYLFLGDSPQPLFWLLDDVFNEFDSQREIAVMQNILADVSYYIVTSTSKPFLSTNVYTVSDLTIKLG